MLKHFKPSERPACAAWLRRLYRISPSKIQAFLQASTKTAVSLEREKGQAFPLKSGQAECRTAIYFACSNQGHWNRALLY